MFFGNKIRNLREEKGLLLRQVVAALEIDTTTISKTERDDRQAKRAFSQIIRNLGRGI